MNKMNLMRVFALMLALALAMPVVAWADGATAKAPAAASVVLNEDAVTLMAGTGLYLNAAVEPYDASQQLTWKSSNTKIAMVYSDGLVVAVRPGEAVITASTKNGKKATCTVTVSQSFAGVDVRFYGIGNAVYTNLGPEHQLPACRGDLDAMARLYRNASYNGKPAEVFPFNDRTRAGIVEVLETMAANKNIDEDDITIFYYTGHGIAGGGSSTVPRSYNGALVGADISYAEVMKGDINKLVPIYLVQSYLDRVPGTVVVIVDSCYTGAFIKDKSIAKTDLSTAGDAWIDAFSRSTATNFESKALPDSNVKTKYRILTASSNSQLSMALPSMSLFTNVLVEYMNQMTADTKKDGVIALHEVYTKVHSYLQSYRARWNRGKKPTDPTWIEQVTQVWPKGNAMPIYARVW